MKTTIKAACVFALIASQAAAIEVQEPEPPVVIVERESNNGGSGAEGALALLVVIGALVIMSNRRGAAPDLSTPRPMVRPQTCMDKHGMFVACSD